MAFDIMRNLLRAPHVLDENKMFLGAGMNRTPMWADTWLVSQCDGKVT